MYEIVTEIILDRKSSQGGPHRPLQKINLLEKPLKQEIRILLAEKANGNSHRYKTMTMMSFVQMGNQIKIPSLKYYPQCCHNMNHHLVTHHLSMIHHRNSVLHQSLNHHREATSCHEMNPHYTMRRLSMTHHTMSRHQGTIRQHNT